MSHYPKKSQCIGGTLGKYKTKFGQKYLKILFVN